MPVGGHTGVALGEIAARSSPSFAATKYRTASPATTPNLKRMFDTLEPALLHYPAMATEARILGLQCLRCRARFDEPRLFTGCPRCRAEGVAVNLTVEYDLAPLAGVTREAFAPAGKGLWRFRHLLPRAPAKPVSLGEGATPLVHLERLGRRLGVPKLYAKDESQNPTWSYKDRLCARGGHARGRDRRARDHDLVHRQPRRVHRGVRRPRRPAVRGLHARLGARDHEDADAGLRRRRGRLPDLRVALGPHAPGHRAVRLVPDQRLHRPTGRLQSVGIEGYKTIAYEVAEDLGWTAPDVVVVPSAYSDGLYGIWKGWTELQTLGLVKHAPRMIAAEPFGPLAHALERKLAAPEIVEAPAPSVAFSIASRYGTWQGLAALRDSGGAGVRLTDEGIFEAQRALAREEGLYVEPSSAAALTAVMQLAGRKALDPEQTIVIVLTSGGLKDTGATRTWLPPVPAADGDLDRVLTVLREAYGLALD